MEGFLSDLGPATDNAQRAQPLADDPARQQPAPAPAPRKKPPARKKPGGRRGVASGSAAAAAASGGYELELTAQQIHGALGISTDTPMAHMYMWARALRLADGPDEVSVPSVHRVLNKCHIDTHLRRVPSARYVGRAVHTMPTLTRLTRGTLGSACPPLIPHHPSAQVHLAAIGKAEIKQQLAAAAN